MRVFAVSSSLFLLSCAPPLPAETPRAEPPTGDNQSEGEGDVAGFADLDGTFALAGGGRPAQVVLPDSYDGQTALPLLLLLHGYGVTGPEMEQYTRFQTFANDNGILYIAPTGTVAQGKTFWNAFGAGPNDSAYLRGLVAEASLGLNVDASRVFVLGHSNGGFMAHQLACDHSDVFSGVVAVAGPVQPARCEPSEPVAVLHVHGTADSVVQYDGGTFGMLQFIGADATTAFWAGANGCGPDAELVEAQDYVDATPGIETDVFRFGGCNGCGAVERWTMRAVEHAPFLNTAFFDDMLTFLRTHPRVGGS
jgi:polyhydroxybutyrate depolymerase